MNRVIIKEASQKKYDFPFDAHLGQGGIFCRLEFRHNTSSKLLTIFLNFLMKFISSPSPSKLKCQIKTFLETYALTKVFNLYTQILQNLSNKVVHNLDLVM